MRKKKSRFFNGNRPWGQIFQHRNKILLFNFYCKIRNLYFKIKSKFTNRKHPEPWNALLTSKEEEARKGALQIVRLITPLPTYRGWWESPTAVDSSKLGSPWSWPSHLAQCSIIWCSFSQKKAIKDASYSIGAIIRMAALIIKNEFEEGA